MFSYLLAKQRWQQLKRDIAKWIVDILIEREHQSRKIDVRIEKVKDR